MKNIIVKLIKTILKLVLSKRYYSKVRSIYQLISCINHKIGSTSTNDVIDASLFQKKGISIIITTIKKSQYLSSLVTELDKQIQDSDCKIEIILISQLENIGDKFHKSNIKHYFFKKALGFSAAVNEGARLSQYDHLLIMNDDLIIPSNFISKMSHNIKNKKFCYLSPITALPGKYKKSHDNKINIDDHAYPYVQDLDGSYLVVNAGSNENGDIGFMKLIEEVDFDRPSSLCGACLLIKTKFLLGSDIFINELFAYFEDRHLTSQFQSNKNYPLLVDKDLVVEHALSSSSSNFDSKYKLVERASSMYQFLINNAPLHEKYINKNTYEFLKRKDLKHLYNSHKSHYKRVCIYNVFFETKGGGERVTIDFSIELSKHSNLIVYLPVFSNDEYNYVKEQISSRENNLRVIHVTKQYLLENLSWFDIFINFSHGIDIINSKVDCHKYIHFPVTENDNETYPHRIFNSMFSRDNACNGNINSSILYPTYTNNLNSKKTIKNKKKSIIVLGRFFDRFHSKNQHTAINAFLDSEAYKRGWELELIGSYRKDGEQYFEKCKKIATHKSIHFYPFLSDKEKDKILCEGSVILSCTGVNSIKAAEQEHFGIAVLEGITSGLFPIVYNSGGPKEIISLLGQGTSYDNYISLTQTLRNLDNLDLVIKSETLKKADDLFSAKSFQNNITEIVNEYF